MKFRAIQSGFWRLSFWTLAVLLVAALPAAAHPGHGPMWGFAAGVQHPLSGIDHLLAMIAVGLWAAQLGGRSRWLVPAAFVGVMTLGAVLGHAGFAIAGIEQGIAASILVLGLLIACAVKLPTVASMAIVGAFALFHGVAHGAEMPATASGLSYGVGFVASTILLHVIGLGLGLALKDQQKVARFAGGTVAIVGAIALIA